MDGLQPSLAPSVMTQHQAHFLYCTKLVMLQPAELEALAGKALKAALAEEQYQRGVIVDGLNSQYLTLDMAANLLLSSLGLQKSCKLPAPCLF